MNADAVRHFAMKLQKFKLDSLKELMIASITDLESKLPPTESIVDHENLRDKIQRAESYQALLRYIADQSWHSKKDNFADICQVVYEAVCAVMELSCELDYSAYKKQKEMFGLSI